MRQVAFLCVTQTDCGNGSQINVTPPDLPSPEQSAQGCGRRKLLFGGVNSGVLPILIVIS